MDIIDWEEMLLPYGQVVDEICAKLRFIDSQLRRANKYSPIESVEGRVKTKSSILDKAARKSIRLEEICEKIEDIAGVRVICQFTEDIDKVVSLIREREDIDMRILTERDYIANTKPSGYRSYHIHIVYPLTTVDGVKQMLAEIQIRTLAMNFWATIEHSLKYKYSGKLPSDVQARLRSAAEAAYNLDLEMSTIRGEIMEAQKIVSVREELVDRINKSIGDLYNIAKIDKASELHRRFLELYSEGNVEKLQEFSQHLNTLTNIYSVRIG